MPTKVIFRKDGDEVVAVFPEMPYDAQHMTRYGSISSAGERHYTACSLAWYLGTKRAQPSEYLPLLTELQGIYTDGLDVKHRLHPNMHMNRARNL